MTQTWGTWTEDGQHVTGTEIEMRELVESSTPLKRGWTGEWRDYLVVRGERSGLQYVRTDSKGRYIKNGRPSATPYPVGPVIRPVL